MGEGGWRGEWEEEEDATLLLNCCSFFSSFCCLLRRITASGLEMERVKEVSGSSGGGFRLINKYKNIK